MLLVGRIEPVTPDLPEIWRLGKAKYWPCEAPLPRRLRPAADSHDLTRRCASNLARISR